MKTLEELKKDLEQINSRIFLIQMADHWDRDDEAIYYDLRSQANELENQIKELENAES